MTYHIEYTDSRESYEYHGNTAIERIRLLNGSIERQWILFDTVEEASAYFHEQCN